MAKGNEAPSDDILQEMVSSFLCKLIEKNGRTGKSKFEEKLDIQLEYVVDLMIEDLIVKNETLIRAAVEKEFRKNVGIIAKEMTESYIESRYK